MIILSLVTILVGIVLIAVSITALAYAYEPVPSVFYPLIIDHSTWVPNNYGGYAVVDIVHFEPHEMKILCKHHQWIGCHVQASPHYHLIGLPIWDAYEYRDGFPGCNIYTHEVLHAWGYTHDMMAHFFTCGVESKYKTLPVLGVT